VSLPISPSGRPSSHSAERSERRAHRQFVVPGGRLTSACALSLLVLFKQGDKVTVSRRSRLSLRFRRRTHCRRSRAVSGSQCAPLAHVEAAARWAFSRLFAHLPEVELPERFDRDRIRYWVARISAGPRRRSVELRLDSVLAGERRGRSARRPRLGRPALSHQKSAIQRSDR
jgi:hypothetical protein